MESDLDQIIKRTQGSLGKFIKRPPLTDKLLKKPPFRFLHDITTSVLTSTGFFAGLFDDKELISENVKDKESKISFLHKIIFVVGTTTGKKLSVKPSKIVAGQEPEKTNLLLQCLADALDRNLTSEEAVKKFKESLNIESNDKTKPDEKNLAPKNKEKSKHDKNVPNKLPKKESPPKQPKQNIKQASKIKTDNSNNVSKVIKKATENINKINKPLKENVYIHDEANDLEIQSTEADINKINEGKSFATDTENNIICNADSTIQPHNIEKDINQKENVELEKNEEPSSIDKSSDITTNSSDKDKTCDDKHEVKDKSDDNEVSQKTLSHDTSRKTDDISINKVNIRPSSSRPGAPRIRDKQENHTAPKDTVVLGKVNIISENTLLEEEDESFQIVDTALEFDNSKQNLEEVLSAEHGHLVQQILDSQKDFTKSTGSTEIEWQFGIQKARDDISKDIELLRFSIQAISRVANPLGKLLDHIQEDVEVMRQELIQWTKAYEETSRELSKQKALNEESLLPLYARIKQLDEEIAEKQEKINDGQIIFHKNNFKIERLLANGSVQY
ncbi:TRAF3-interacting protein 1 [Leptidea sinapis]|uniref:TRAF3-interacting protein 1 n=1 Tax=Leptidea sinapis TaxID=189913 RepID=UPI002136DA21|nr:TRAF3-interacting protein 1 [Leptidea sinapis]